MHDQRLDERGRYTLKNIDVPFVTRMVRNEQKGSMTARNRRVTMLHPLYLSLLNAPAILHGRRQIRMTGGVGGGS